MCSQTPLSDLPKEKLISKIIELYESKNELLAIVADMKSTINNTFACSRDHPTNHQLHLRNPSTLLVEEMMTAELDIVAGEGGSSDGECSIPEIIG